MANKRIHELTADSTPDADAYLVLDKSTYAAPVKSTVTQLLQNLPVAPQTVGGNARGTGAVDLQVTRAANTQVASGNCATIGGGHSNTSSGFVTVVGGGIQNIASGEDSSILGGEGNTASGDYSVVGGGATNIASGIYASVPGGHGNTASGNCAVIGGGYGSTASEEYATIGGGNNNLASDSSSTVSGGAYNIASLIGATVPGGINAKADKYCQLAYAAGQFTAAGDAQHSVYVARFTTANATPAVLLLDGSAALLTIAADTAWHFRAEIVGITGDATAYGGYTVTGLVRSNNTTVSVHGVATVTVAESAAGWDATAVADDVNKALSIQVTGAAGATIRWVATIYTTECTFA